MASLAFRSTVSTLSLLLALGVAYGFVLAALGAQWADDPNYAHGFFVPPMAAWLAWRRRERWRAAAARPATGGLVLVVAGCALYLAGVLAAELFTTRVSLVIVLAGMVAAVHGWERLRVVAFPIGFLLCMIPLPYVIYYRLTFPLQIESSRLAAGVLSFLGLPVVREGNILHLEGYTLEIVTACSGLRSIMTLGTIGIFLVEFFRLSRVRLAAYLALIIPVAVAANVARLVTTAAVAAIAGPESAESFLHELSGLVVFVTGMLALVAGGKALAWTGRPPS